jgi:hypothetical protein
LLDSTQQNIFTLIQAWSGEESNAATDSPFLLEPPIETSTQQQTQVFGEQKLYYTPLAAFTAGRDWICFGG